jgi:DNA helicase-2/ATP-dependent DNA helicase PcrA
MAFDLSKELNKQQTEAATCTSGPSIILAGAGSGKTRVLTQKALYLILHRQVSPLNILMVTFTNKAALEMKSRIKQHLGFVGTFHSFSAKVLRADGEHIGLDKNFLIYDEEDQQEIMKEILKNSDFEKNHSPNYFLDKISQAKNQLIDETQYLKLFKDFFGQAVAQVYSRYQKELKENNALDFDDLIFKTVLLFIKDEKVLNKYQEKFKYILVDEFHDTNYAQYVLTKYLSEKYKNITVVGDFSQSIYSWRGAEIRNLEKFREDFPKAKIFYLEKNYRSSQKILNFAYEIISKNQSHPILKLYTDNPQGQDIVINQLDNEQYEALFVSTEIEKLINNGCDLKSVAIFYRMNAQSRIIEEAFLHLGIPYILVGGTRFYERREIKDILSYVRLTVNPLDRISIERVLKIGKKKFGKFKELYKRLKDKKEEIETIKMIDKIFEATGYLEQFSEENPEDLGRLENIKELRSVAINFPNVNDFLEQVALVESEYSESEKKKKNHEGVYMMTLHQAKGLEFPYVFIVGLEEGILPHLRSFYDVFDLEEERRLFYVGITRAKEKLYITYTKKRFLFGRRTQSQVSRFLEEKDGDIC